MYIFMKCMCALAPLFQILCSDVCLALQYHIPLFLLTLFSFKNRASPSYYIFFPSANIFLHRLFLGYLIFVTICTSLLRSVSRLGTFCLCIHHGCGELRGRTRSSGRSVFALSSLPSQ